ncbi:MAG: hypothetical protein HYZ14_07415 [Bacteroidetes bacterium]|nr:hypothetical protein [Bacteroidota bacterium]
MDIEKYIERKIDGLNVLRFSNELYVPGAIIDQRENDLRVGHLKDVLKDTPPGYWDISRLPGNILLEESISGSSKFGAKTNFLGVFNLKAGVKNEYDLDYTIDEITCAEFNQASQLELEMKLNQLERSEKASWEVLKGRTLITVAFYAKSFTLTFKRSGKVTANAEVERDVAINGAINAEWKNEGQVIISGNELIPFGIRGFKIR